MYSRFVLEADAREIRALLGIVGRLAGKVLRSIVVELSARVTARARKIGKELRENAERGARGWR